MLLFLFRCWIRLLWCVSQIVRDGVPRGKSRDEGTLITLFIDEFIRHLLAKVDEKRRSKGKKRSYPGGKDVMCNHIHDEIGGLFALQQLDHSHIHHNRKLVEVKWKCCKWCCSEALDVLDASKTLQQLKRVDHC